MALFYARIADQGAPVDDDPDEADDQEEDHSCGFFMADRQYFLYGDKNPVRPLHEAQYILQQVGFQFGINILGGELIIYHRGELLTLFPLQAIFVSDHVSPGRFPFAGCVFVLLHGHVSVAGTSKIQIPYDETLARAAAIETAKLSVNMMTGQCLGTAAECAADHEYVVLRASLLAQHCDQALHQSKDVCMMLWKSYIHRSRFDTDVLTNAFECGATYITKNNWDYPTTTDARTIEREKGREDTKSKLLIEDWLKHFSVQTTEQGVRSVAKRLFDQINRKEKRIDTTEMRTVELSKYAKGRLMGIIEEYKGMFYVEFALC